MSKLRSIMLYMNAADRQELIAEFFNRGFRLVPDKDYANAHIEEVCSLEEYNRGLPRHRHYAYLPAMLEADFDLRYIEKKGHYWILPGTAAPVMEIDLQVPFKQDSHTYFCQNRIGFRASYLNYQLQRMARISKDAESKFTAMLRYVKKKAKLVELQGLNCKIRCHVWSGAMDELKSGKTESEYPLITQPDSR